MKPLVAHMKGGVVLACFSHPIDGDTTDPLVMSQETHPAFEACVAALKAEGVVPTEARFYVEVRGRK